MERGDCCQSPAPRSRAGRPRVQRLREEPERGGRGPGSGLHESAEPRAGDLSCAAAPFTDPPPTLLVRFCRSGNQESPGTGHLRLQPGGESWEPRALPLRRLGLQVANFSNSMGRGIGDASGSEGSGKLEPGSGGCRREARRSSGFRRPLPPRLGHLRRCSFPVSCSLRSSCAGPLSGGGLRVWAAAPMGTRSPGLEEGTVE